MMPDRIFFLAILLAYLLVGSLYAVYTPAWQAPDEPAHYNYVRQLADGRLPRIEPGDYDQAYQQTVISSQFDPQYSVAPFEYEDWQPPLYYLLLTPIFWLSGGSMVALRLVSLLLGAGVVGISYLIARRLWVAEWPALTAAAFVAFLPQHVAILASINNDSLAELLIAAILLLLIGYVLDDSGEPERPTLFALGLLLGLGFLTKGTVYLMAPVILLSLVWHYRRRRDGLINWRGFVRANVVVFLPALFLGLLWWGRNAAVYGGLDLLGKQAHDAVVTGQPRTADWIASYGLGETVSRFVRTTFQSFWGQFGWMGVPMPSWVYQLLLLFTGLTVVGAILALSHYFRQHHRWIPLLLLGSLFLLSLGLYLGYNLTFVQHQGRYLFPALIPIALGVAAGWTALLQPLWRRWPAAGYLLPLGLALALLGLDLLALFRFIVPALA